MRLSNAIEIVEAIVTNNLKQGDKASNASYLIPMLWSLPGEGKTTAVEDLADKLGAELRTVIVAQFDAGELGGFPALNQEEKMYERYAPFFMKNFPEDKPTILFLDELPQAPGANLNIMAQLVNERRIGEHQLPNNVAIVCAGNPMSARAGTQQLPTHLKDRLTHLNIETDHEGFRQYALANGFRPEITGFINDRPEWLQKFDPAADACPSPRSWERVNTILGLGLVGMSERGALTGQIGEAAVTDFSGYLRIYRDLPNYQDIFEFPETSEIPSSPDILYALCSNLAHKVRKETAEALVTYVKRFDSKEFAAFCIRDVLARDSSFKQDKHIANWVVTEGRDLLL